ncbi:discoidin domain-containing protein [Bacteroides sp. AN502(2024)]|uniref:discoidin domain-containing protein n=1 Tax=Bacteroides sp. AN502(2024) TaxID=3160599 RepID=UPI003513E6E8
MKNLMHILTVTLSLLFTGSLFVACDDDEKTVVVPDNWVTVKTDPMSISYEGGTLSLDYELANGLDERVVYVISSENWCSGYIEDGKMQIDVEPSEDIDGRAAKVFLTYDAGHQVELVVNQEKAPVILVTSIDKSAVPEGINLEETLDLNTVVKVLPANASYQDLRFTLAEGSEQYVSLSAAGVVTGRSVGTAQINVSTTDESGVKDVITLKVKGDIILNRTDWTVSTFAKYANGQNYVTDNNTGKPEHILDGKQNTYLSLIKPGKSMSGYVGTTDPNFTVDMQKEQTFNYFYWQHRKQNDGFLQVLSVDIYGSHDNQTFEKINNAVVSIIPNLYDIQYFDIPESTYRYVKVQYRSYSSGGSSAQVAEFGLGRKL